MFQGLDLSVSSGTQKELGCFHWALNQSASVIYKTLVEILAAHFTVNFTAVVPQLGIVPLSTALLQGQ
jgi:hypothetical protein